MKIIQTLVDRISDELDDANRYAAIAHSVKAEYPRLADKIIDLAETEMGHARLLHAEVVKLIEEVKQRQGEPPADMMAIYNYEHEKQVKRAAAIRQLIAEYRDM